MARPPLCGPRSAGRSGPTRAPARRPPAAKAPRSGLPASEPRSGRRPAGGDRPRNRGASTLVERAVGRGPSGRGPPLVAFRRSSGRCRLPSGRTVGVRFSRKLCFPTTIRILVITSCVTYSSSSAWSGRFEAPGSRPTTTTSIAWPAARNRPRRRVLRAPTCGSCSPSRPRRSARTGTSHAGPSRATGSAPRPRLFGAQNSFNTCPDENPGAVDGVGQPVRPVRARSASTAATLHPRRLRVGFLTLGAARSNAPGSAKARRGRRREPSSRPPLR